MHRTRQGAERHELDLLVAEEILDLVTDPLPGHLWGTWTSICKVCDLRTLEIAIRRKPSRRWGRVGGDVHWRCALGCDHELRFEALGIDLADRVRLERLANPFAAELAAA